jgi:hypothetical protein
MGVGSLNIMSELKIKSGPERNLRGVGTLKNYWEPAA